MQLRSEIECLHKSMDAFQTSLSAKMDFMVSLQIAVVTLTEQHNATRASVDRAFAEMKAIEASLITAHNKITWWSGFSKCLTFVAVVMFPAVQWWVVSEIQGLEAQGRSFIDMDRRLAWLEHEKLGREIPNVHPK